MKLNQEQKPKALKLASNMLKLNSNLIHDEAFFKGLLEHLKDEEN